MKRSSERRSRRRIVEELTRCIDLRLAESASLVPVYVRTPRLPAVVPPVHRGRP